MAKIKYAGQTKEQTVVIGVVMKHILSINMAIKLTSILPDFKILDVVEKLMLNILKCSSSKKSLKLDVYVNSRR